MARTVALWKRVVAYLIDLLVLSFVVVLPLMQPLSRAFFGDDFVSLFQFFSTTFSGQYVFFAVVLALLFLLYWSVLECWIGQSVGKMLLGLRVEGTKKKGVSFLQAVLRNVTKLSMLLLFFDVLYMLFQKKDQRYFEVLSDTHVVAEVKEG